MTPIIVTAEADPRLTHIAAAMWAICCMDREEDEIAMLAIEYSECLPESDYLAVWELLDAHQRSAWKGYCALGRELRSKRPVVRR